MTSIEDYIPLLKIQKHLNRSRTYMWQWFKELTACGRYPEDSILQDGRRKYIKGDVVEDFLRNRKKIQSGDLLPPFRKERK